MNNKEIKSLILKVQSRDVNDLAIRQQEKAAELETRFEGFVAEKTGFLLQVHHAERPADEWEKVRWFTRRSFKIPGENWAEEVESAIESAVNRTSNHWGDVDAVRVLPYLEYHTAAHAKYESDYFFNEAEALVWHYKDDGSRRQWNRFHLYVVIGEYRHIPSIVIDRRDISPGDNLNWWLPWHFSLADECPCPVAPVMVEWMDKRSICLSYQGKSFTLEMESLEGHTVLLDQGHVEPNHKWDDNWHWSDPFDFKAYASIKYDSFGELLTNKAILQRKPSYNFKGADFRKA